MSEESTEFLTLYIITFLIGFPNSVLAFYSSIHKLYRKPIPIDVFMLNLAASDLVFLTFLPLKMKEAADDMFWLMPDSVCKFSLFVYFLPLYISSLFLTAISVERYVCVAFPVKYKSPKRIFYTVLICVGIWVLAAVTSVFPYLAAFSNSDEADNVNQSTLLAEPQRCNSNYTAKQLKKLLPVRLGIAVACFFLPFLICCFCYFSFIRILLKLPLINRKRKLRAIGLALGTLLVFASSFSPFNASQVVSFITKKIPDWRMKAMMLCTLNVCFDPVIFFCISNEMRNTIKVCKKVFYQFYANLKQFIIFHVHLQIGVNTVSCN